MTMISVKPAPGRRVRRPDGEVLDAGGESVADDTYWQRRLSDEDVAIVPTTPVKKAS